MTNYTQFAVKDLHLKWAEIIGGSMPPVRRSLIVKYLIWYEQAKREKVSSLGFLMRLNRRFYLLVSIL